MAHEYSNLIASYNAPDLGCAGAQQAKPATDREQLEAAIAYWAEQPYSSKIQPLYQAARKHLETLPKTVTKWRVSYQPDDFVMRRRTWRMTDSENEALESAQYALACGKRSVSIDKIEVQS